MDNMVLKSGPSIKRVIIHHSCHQQITCNISVIAKCKNAVYICNLSTDYWFHYSSPYSLNTGTENAGHYTMADFAALTVSRLTPNLHYTNFHACTLSCSSQGDDGCTSPIAAGNSCISGFWDPDTHQGSVRGPDGGLPPQTSSFHPLANAVYLHHRA